MTICNLIIKKDSFLSMWLTDNVSIFNDNPMILMNQGLMLLNADSANIDVKNFEDDSIKITDNIKFSYECFIKADSISASNYAKYAIGVLEYCRGDIYAAIDTLKRIVINDINPEVAYVLGRIYEKQNMIEDAISIYVSMLCNRPDIFGSEFYYDLSIRSPALADSIRTLVVEKLNDKYLKNDEDVIIGARLARCLIEIGEYERSKYLLQKTINILPNMNRPYLYMGDNLWNEGNYEDAKSYYVKARMLDRNDILCNGRLYQRFGIPNQKNRTNFKQAIGIQVAYEFKFTSNPEILNGITNYLLLRECE